MTTLYRYLSSIPELSDHVFWDEVDTRDSHLYALLYEGPVGIARALHQNQDVQAKSTSVALYQPPSTTSNLATQRKALSDLLEQVEYAVHFVDTDTDGKTLLSGFYRAGGMPIAYDPVTKGLGAVVRFSVQVLRR